MADMTKKHHEPLMHIAKRDELPGWAAWLIRIAAILLGFLVTGILSSLLTKAPIGECYQIMFKGVFGRLLQGKTTLLWRFLQQTAILLCLALAVTPAFKMRFWNCGAEGQSLIGGLAAMICMIELGGLGFMSAASTVVFLLRRKVGLRQKMVIAQALNLNDMDGVVKIQKLVLTGSLTIQGIGALILFFRFLPDYGFSQALYWGIFHSISAFCNAGFSTSTTVDSFFCFLS